MSRQCSTDQHPPAPAAETASDSIRFVLRNCTAIIKGIVSNAAWICERAAHTHNHTAHTSVHTRTCCDLADIQCAHAHDRKHGRDRCLRARLTSPSYPLPAPLRAACNRHPRRRMPLREHAALSSLTRRPTCSSTLHPWAGWPPKSHQPVYIGRLTD